MENNEQPAFASYGEAQKGYSVVGLMLVVLAIGLLAVISINLLNDSRARARDNKRLVDTRRIQTSLEFYNLEHNSYPLTEGAVSIGEGDKEKLCDGQSGTFVEAAKECQTTFMDLIPSDPKTFKGYSYSGGQKGYSLGFTTEKNTILGAAGKYYAHSQTVDQDSGVK